MAADRVQLWPAYEIRRDQSGRFLAVANIEIHGRPIAGKDGAFDVEFAGQSIAIEIGSHRTADSFSATRMILLGFAMIVDTDVIYRVKRRLARAVIPELLYENRNVSEGSAVPPELESAVLARIFVATPRTPKTRKRS